MRESLEKIACHRVTRATVRVLAFAMPVAVVLVGYRAYSVSEAYWQKYDEIIEEMFATLDEDPTLDTLTQRLARYKPRIDERPDGTTLWFDNLHYTFMWIETDAHGRVGESLVIFVSDPLPREGPWFADPPEYAELMKRNTIAACLLWAISFAVPYAPISWAMRAVAACVAVLPVFWGFTGILNIYAYG